MLFSSGKFDLTFYFLHIDYVHRNPINITNSTQFNIKIKLVGVLPKY